MNSEQLRAQFKTIRTKANIKTVDLEAQTKTGGGSVSNFENGTTNIGIEKLLKWCEALGVEISIRKMKKVIQIQNHE